MRDFSIQSGNCSSAALIREALVCLLRSCDTPPVFLCVGSDRITGDCLGPLVGHLLTTKHSIGCFVYGTLESTVTAKNVLAFSSLIAKKHSLAKIVAIDAALGAESDVGKIRVGKHGLVPAAALGKNLPSVGDLSITAIVGAMSQGCDILQGIRLSTVLKFAVEIAEAISMATQKLFPVASQIQRVATL